jgi:sugar phosphate isomerase/epimerase
MTPTTNDLGREDLIASFYTLSGAPNAAVSRYPFVERVRAAGVVGYAGIGLTMFDIDACIAAGLTPAVMAQAAADHGTRVAEVETLAFTPTPTADEIVAARRMAEVGGLLGARHMNVLIGLPPATPVDVDEAAAGFATVCDIAAENGLLVAFEFMPFKAVATLAAALPIVERAGRSNGGLVVDSYHFYRGGSRIEDLASVPSHRFVTLQLSDIPSAAPQDLLTETRTARALPGQGELPLVEWIRAVDAAGSTATAGVEVLSDDLRRLDVDEAARATYEATAQVLATARNQ